mmetsp:Transcript_7363/g.22443  ORF Transcript_7363/g.22443 Transcript_7363/m.22443 type:complete len:178 (-) Transcript_7363:819-1352(-)
MADDPVRQRTILDRTLSKAYDGLEYSAHYAPRSMIRELRSVFPSVSLPDSGTIVVPTTQKACVPLTNYGDDEAREKDRLLEKFMEWAAQLYKALSEAGFWADYTDPCTGLPVHGTAGGSIYPDVDGFERLLRFKVDASMGCRIMSHPDWSFASYPATFFTTAPAGELLPILTRLNEG